MVSDIQTRYGFSKTLSLHLIGNTSAGYVRITISSFAMRWRRLVPAWIVRSAELLRGSRLVIVANGSVAPMVTIVGPIGIWRTCCWARREIRHLIWCLVRVFYIRFRTRGIFSGLIHCGQTLPLLSC